MEKGNEGDEILLLTFRQFLCPLPSDVNNVNQLTVELLFNIVSKAVLSISSSDEDEQFQELPQNIASRHRMCTTLANKVKDLGFDGDCGYNQLLYPVESQTRILLNWLVVRLPRNEEDVTENIIGEKTQRNLNIANALRGWKSMPWRLHFCTSTRSPTDFQQISAPFRTYSSNSNNNVTAKELLSSTSSVTAISTNGSLAPTMLERHAIQLHREAFLQTQLQSSFSSASSASGRTGGGSGSGSGGGTGTLSKEELYRHIATKANAARSRNSEDIDDGPEAALAASREGWSVVDLCGLSLGQLVQTIAQRHRHGDGDGDAVAAASGNSSNKPSRFALATAFAKKEEDYDVVTTSTSSTNNVGGSGMTGECAVGIDGDAQKAIAMLQRTKKEEEEAKEDRQREQELDELRSAVTVMHQRVETLSSRNQASEGDMEVKMRLVQTELNGLTSLGEKLEKDIMMKGRALQMLTSSSENIDIACTDQLNTLCAAAVSKLVELAQEWEKHRVPLINRIRALQQMQQEVCVLRSGRGAVEISSLMCRVLTQSLRERKEKGLHLNNELSLLPKNLSRSTYTHRILDIIASIAKQDEEISKIASDIRNIQKSIN
eukprot:gene7376-15063_t